MLKDGEYSAWFRTGQGQGTGQVFLRDGNISGGDAFISYGGTYQVEGTRFTATLTTRRHTDGRPSVFGIDEVEVKLIGSASERFASCSGEVAAVPGMMFEATLIPTGEEDQPRERKRDPQIFHLERLPKHKVR
jgi:hypothetical protein